VAVLSGIVATSIFVSLSEDPRASVKIVVGAVAALAAVLSALQIFYHFERRAEEHRTAGATYAGLRRKFENFLIACPLGASEADARGPLLEEFKNLTEQIEESGRSAPLLPKKAVELAQRQIE
jgi:hypothetical protein